MRVRYSRWDGTQDPLGPDLSASDLLEEMSDDMLSGEGADAALGRLLRRGIRGRFGGTDALRARLRNARAQEQERLDLVAFMESLTGTAEVTGTVRQNFPAPPPR